MKVFKKNVATFGATLLALLNMWSMQSCDDGRIYDEPSGAATTSGGRTVRFSANIDGSDSYPAGYCVALAGFGPDSEYAVISRNLSDGPVDLSLLNLPEDAVRVEVCLLNSIRKRIVTFAGIDIDPGESSASFEAGDIRASHFDAIEQGVFATSCERCHGAGSHAAAGLSLLRGEAMGEMVGVESSVVPGKLRVDPGNPDGSTLWLAIGTDASRQWAFAHGELLTSDKRELILSWINNLSKE